MDHTNERGAIAAIFALILMSLLRQYFPKGTDISQLTQGDVDDAAHSLNGRPRQTLNWMTPSDKLAEALQ